MIIFLHGEDSFRSQQKLREYKERFLKKYGGHADLIVIDVEESPDVDIFKTAGSAGLFSPVRLIVVENLISRLNRESQETFVGLLKLRKNILSGKDVVIILYEKDDIRGTSPLYKFLQKHADCQKFERLNGIALHKWINTRLSEFGSRVALSSKAAEKLAAYAAGNTRVINNELQKLVNFKESGEISEKDIDCLATAIATTTIFETIEAASSGNKKLALKLLHEHLNKNEDPFYILSMYVYQFRNMLKINEIFWNGVTDKTTLSKITKIHPFVIQKTLSQLRNFSMPKLKNIYRELQKLDEDAKNGKLTDIRMGLDAFLANF
jgi:DNA polymerase III subunit delta